MKTVLLNHVVSGAVRAEDLTDGMMAENLAGNMMTIRYFLDLGFTPFSFFDVGATSYLSTNLAPD